MGDTILPAQFKDRSHPHFAHEDVHQAIALLDQALIPLESLTALAMGSNHQGVQAYAEQAMQVRDLVAKLRRDFGAVQ